MINKILLIEKQSLKRLKTLNEQESEEYYKITPEEYEELMKLSGYHESVTKLKKFGGKPLWITGNVDLKSTPTSSLGNVAYIEGSLDISRTNIKDLGNTNVKRHVWDSNTPRERIRIAAELREKKSEMDEDRKNRTRDLDNPTIDDEDEKAVALFKWLVENGDATEMDDEKKQEIERIQNELDELNKKYEESDESEEYNEIYDRITELEEELEEITPKIDVYDLYQTSRKYGHYGLTTFEILDPDFRNQEYSVGTDSEMDEAALEYAKNLIDDIGLDGFKKGYIDSYIDEDEFKYYVEDFYEDDIWQNPEVYFSDDDWELTEEQEKRIETLQIYIEDMGKLKSDIENEQNEIESEIEDPDEYSSKWDELQSKIDEIDENIEKAQEEIDDIEPDRNEPTQEMVDSKLKEMVEDALYDPADWIKNYGLDLKQFIDKDKLAQGVVDDDGWGVISGYDGRYDSVYVNNTTYYVMRIN